uniref:Reducing polyketide synthase FUB1 ) n=1 Tax=Ganoderma boninense TaxID=34458 RepID=A0A5K1K8D0_9APHY|nr:Reducing polyketide synthase FUB1 (EC (Fusaric acid biosynthesis protein 1) [Ganoderma boninense]
MESVHSQPPVHYRERKNEAPCGGLDNVDNGCQMVFVRMEPGRKLCFLCVKLKDSANSGANIAEIRASYTQCGECGICGTTVTDPCGTCRRADNFEKGVPDHDRETAAERRRANLDGKLLNRSDNPDVGTAVPLQELQAIRATQGFSAPTQRAQVPHCTIYYECRRSDAAKHVDQMLGTGVIFFPEVNTMLSLRSRIVKEVNGRWTEFYSAPLLEEETALRAPNNYVFPKDDLVMTVAQWYQSYSRPEYRDTYIVLPKHPQRKGKQNSKLCSFSLELYIYVGQYAARTADSEVLGSGRAGTKRKTSTPAVAVSRVGSPSSKRVRETTSSQPVRQTLRSMFVGDGNLLAQPPSAISAVKIQFKKTTCLISEGSGSPTLIEESSFLSGFLETRPLDLNAGDRGIAKDVYGLRIGTRSYVAKKLVNVGGGRSEDIPLSKTINVLTADLIRLKRMGYFADKFKTLAYDHGVDVAEFDVSDAFLIKSYKPKPSTVTPAEHADGGNDEDTTDVASTEEVSAVYLVEPLRLSTTVVKFSGTFGSTTRNDLRSLTVSAYAHYVAEQTACRYVFADIQGSNNANSSGKLSLTLFDPMTHTAEGTSGIGNHGRKGLEDFVSNHTCNHICSALQLALPEIMQNTLDEIFSTQGRAASGDQENPSDEDED